MGGNFRCWNYTWGSIVGLRRGTQRLWLLQAALAQPLVPSAFGCVAQPIAGDVHVRSQGCLEQTVSMSSSNSNTDAAAKWYSP